MDHFLSLNAKIPEGSTLRIDPRNETIIYWKGENLSAAMDDDKAFAKLRDGAHFPQMALAFISAHHKFFKLNIPFQELKPTSVTTDDLGYTHIKFRQVFETLPVLNAEIIVHLNPLNRVYLINGRYVPTPIDLSMSPEISKEEAVRRVSEHIADRASEVPEYVTERIIYAPEEGESLLAYQVTIHSNIISAAAIYVVDARTGEILAEFPIVYDTEHRKKHLRGSQKPSFKL